MAWKKIRMRRRYSAGDTGAISIQRNGKITWNKRVQEELGEPEWVDLFLDVGGEEKRLGLMKSVRGEGSAKVNKHSGQNTWTISALGALRVAGLLVERAYRRPAQREGEVVYIDISELLE